MVEAPLEPVPGGSVQRTGVTTVLVPLIGDGATTAASEHVSRRDGCRNVLAAVRRDGAPTTDVRISAGIFPCSESRATLRARQTAYPGRCPRARQWCDGTEGSACTRQRAHAALHVWVGVEVTCQPRRVATKLFSLPKRAAIVPPQKQRTL